MIPINVLRAVVRYEPESGRMFWRKRPLWLATEGHQSVQAVKAFNVNFAGRECFLSTDKDGYLCGGILGRFMRAHRVAYAIHNGRWPVHTVDHCNRVRTDNRAENLRDVTRSVQQQNRSIQGNNSSGFPGVHWSKSHGAWVARKTVNGKRVFVGTFDTAEMAAEAKRNCI